MIFISSHISLDICLHKFTHRTNSVGPEYTCTLQLFKLSYFFSNIHLICLNPLSLKKCYYIILPFSFMKFYFIFFYCRYFFLILVPLLSICQNFQWSMPCLFALRFLLVWYISVVFFKVGTNSKLLSRLPA